MVDKKHLKEIYKNMVPPMGVFSLRNNQTGRVFLGSSLNLKNKYERIKIMLGMGNHYNSELQKDWNDYGEESFTFEILETLEVKDDKSYNYSEDLEILELLWIDKFRPFPEKCYNKNEKIRMV